MVTETRSWIDQVRKLGSTTESRFLSDFKGQALAFTFIFTRCPCPISAR
jgi:hypothetical protein